MRLYGLKTCDTCRKALSELKKSSHDVAVIDVSENGIAPDLALRLHAALGNEVLNRRSTTWRNLPESERNFPVHDLLTAHPKLMKRPVIEAPDGTLHLGWTDAVRSRFIP